MKRSVLASIRQPGLARGGRRTTAKVLAGLLSAGLLGVLAVSGVALAAPKTGGFTYTSGWTSYLNGSQHSSYSPSQKTITPANATRLVQAWSFTTGLPYLASPTVAYGSVFIGAGNGYLYKLNGTTGKVENKAFVGVTHKLTCPVLGVVSTATVATDPATRVPTVYVAGPDGYLYALRASNLKLEWRSAVAVPSTTINNYFNWSSPTVANGKVYMGIASNCVTPMVRGGVLAFDQSTGKRIAAFHSVPRGAQNLGGAVWSSIGVGPDGDVYATTGNGPADAPELGYAESIIKLAPDTLKVLGYYQLPAKQVVYDGDFGSSPAFFDGYVGACDKNGIFYAVSQSTMKLAWARRIGQRRSDAGGACLGTPVWNGKDLYFGGNQTTISGVTSAGSVQERTAHGKLIWETAVPGVVFGSPTMDGAGLIAVGTLIGSGVTEPGAFLVDAATGKLIEQLVQGSTFAQSVFADNWIYCANSSAVSAWEVKPAS